MKQILTLLTSCVLVACAGASGVADGDSGDTRAGRGDCIFESTVRGYTVLDEQNLIIDSSGRRKYHMVLQRRAWGLNSAWGIAFKSTTNNVCAGFDEVVFRNHGDRVESIRIQSIRALSDEDHEDLLIQWGKKEPEIKQNPEPREVKGAEVEELDPAADDPSGN
ncbi:MAG: DUF6491 family protein [Pseudomonadota bacterium]